MPQGDPHAYAVAAEENLEKLATELASAGVSENVVQTVSQMADVVRKIVTALGKGQAATGDDEPPEQPAPQPERRATIGSATEDLHRETMANAARRRQEAS